MGEPRVSKYAEILAIQAREASQPMKACVHFIRALSYYIQIDCIEDAHRVLSQLQSVLRKESRIMGIDVVGVIPAHQTHNMAKGMFEQQSRAFQNPMGSFLSKYEVIICNLECYRLSAWLEVLERRYDVAMNLIKKIIDSSTCIYTTNMHISNQLYRLHSSIIYETMYPTYSSLSDPIFTYARTYACYT